MLLEDPTKPELSISSEAPTTCLEYNPKDVHSMLGGWRDGRVSLWDTRKGGLPVGSSPLGVSHREPIYSALWLSSKAGTECFTSSTDGQVSVPVIDVVKYSLIFFL